ncbi:MAG: iron-containing alcohol dehydrogenase family protein [Candidatus Cloacimonetes bacterium]|nr:iron-containing alcohol dehydrogenase family protein [Candidatus Cloacimonadota bacterium]MDD4156206.1 iron-containing alcohol dehydrogenase family protein [Candidatus Cloacimonadota bacterium]
MYFNIPVKIHFGKNSIKENKKELSSFGKKAFIVTGKHSAKKSGALDDLLEALNTLSIEFILFNEITENPNISSIEKGSLILKQNNCDFIIAIGGGSPLDAAKAISLMYANNLNKNNIFDNSLHKSALPLIAIPTTSGTGSEVTPYSVLTNNETQIKAGFGSPLMFPKISFIDPKYTISANKHITRDTAVDALSHLLEGIYSLNHADFLQPLIFKGIELIYNYLLPCLEEPDNYQFRENLMLASTYGGMVIAHSSTTLQHSIGYPLTTVYGLSHGMANGVVMKNMMNFYEPHLDNRLNKLFEYLRINKQDFFNWLDKLDLKFEHHITEEFLTARIPEVLNSRNMAITPVKVNEEQLKKLYLQLNH